MAGPVLFQIEDGWFGLTLVDPAAVGYAADWQAPGGKEVNEVLITDYGSPGGVDGWRCQVTRGELTASANDTTVSVPATFCAPGSEVPQPSETSFALDLEFLQDPILTDGLTAYLFEHDTAEAYFVVGLVAEGSPPTAIGRVRLLSGNFGGPARENLTSTLSLPVVRKPDIWFGSTPPGRIVTGDGVPPAPLAASASSTSTKATANA